MEQGAPGIGQKWFFTRARGEGGKNFLKRRRTGKGRRKQKDQDGNLGKKTFPEWKKRGKLLEQLLGDGPAEPKYRGCLQVICKAAQPVQSYPEEKKATRTKKELMEQAVDPLQ